MNLAVARRNLAALFLVSSMALAQGASESLERDARSAFKSGRFKEAAIKFQDAAASATDSSRHAKMELQSAYSHFNDRNLKAARDAVHRALVADPEMEIVPEFFAPEFVRLVDEEKRVRPTPPPAPADITELKRIAAEKLADGHAEDVVYDLTHVARERLDPESWTLLARAYEILGRFDQAAAARRGAAGEAVPIIPSPPPPPAGGPNSLSSSPATKGTNAAELLASGRLALVRGDAFTAQSAANRALESQPTSSEAYRLLGDALLAKGDKELAEANWKQSLKNDDKNQETLLTLSDYYVSKGNWDAAIQHLRRAAELNPQHAARVLALGRRLRKDGDLVHSGQIFASYTAMQPADVASLTEYAGLLIQAGDVDAALEPLMKAAAAEPKRAALHANLAAVLRRKAMTKEAAREYREALKADPSHAASAKALGIILLAEGNAPEAAELFKSAAMKDPTDREALLGWARSLRTAGNPEAASSALAASSLDDPALWNEAGAAAYERGRYAEAAEFWGRVLARSPDSAPAKANREKATLALSFLKKSATQPISR